jgi:DNA-binding MarR family transcriptional regulator
MSRKGKRDAVPPFERRLTRQQQRAWLAYMRVQLRLRYEMNRQLQNDSGLSLADYDVLNALRYSPGGAMQITALAALIGWERSRLSHHARRMSARGLVTSDVLASDRRATELRLTDQGWQEITDASEGHIELVRRLFFGGLPVDHLPAVTQALEAVYENVIENGSLPAPVEQTRASRRSAAQPGRLIGP